jgi:uncharacterized protein YbjT (DUF2867 family)
MNTILITGATGNVGRPLVHDLLAAGAHVRALTHHPDRAGFPAGVETVTSIENALPGCSSVFLNSRALGSQLEQVVMLARRHGVGRIVALSAINADDPFDRQPSRMRGDRNHEVERLAIDSGVPWVSLRPAVFASNFAGMWGAQLCVGDVVAGPFADATAAPIADRDISAVAAHALLHDDLIGRRFPLTGPQRLSNAEAVGVIGAVLGRSLRYREVGPEAVRQHFTGMGFPSGFADAYLRMQAATLDVPATVTGEVAAVLGRPATTFAKWVGEHRAAFTKTA